VRAVKQQVRSVPAGASAPQLRATDADDVPILVSLAEGTLVFTPQEIVGLQEDLESCLSGNDPLDHLLTLEHAGHVVGFAQFGPAEITQGTWYLYWIAVDRQSHGHGYGAQILRRVEDEVRGREGRLLLIETSTLPRYEATRVFYERAGYTRECIIRDYYSEGDDKVIFSKRMV
jgi:GNAT superfamily N-acetyltransferase